MRDPMNTVRVAGATAPLITRIRSHRRRWPLIAIAANPARYREEASHLLEAHEQEKPVAPRAVPEQTLMWSDGLWAELLFPPVPEGTSR